MNLSEINWDPNAAGTWPLAVKATIILIVCAMVAGGCIYFDTLDQIEAFKAVQQKEVELRASFEEKQAKAANLPDYQYQLTQIEASLDEMIKQMPTEAEVASLLVDISQTGLASGLEFKLFKPEAPVLKDFYSELPIRIEVMGKYEEIGLFVSGLASLPRIVTVHDVNISPDEKEGVLKMNAIVKTYNEAASTNPADAARKKKRGKQ
ncbi:MAG: type 4a pilus biogenesis protein PilO [Methylococcales bacterium]|nr:type 4a pilus biogenesis protein PilO [Methylococcales bacterium]